MRKFLLYLLLLFLFAGVATFTYGYLNGKKIRGFSGDISEIQTRHDLSPRIEKIETSFRENGKKDITQIRDESKQFSAELAAIGEESRATEKEIGSLSAPGVAEDLKKDAEEYYSKLALQANELKSIIDYMSQIIEVAAYFGEIQENASLDEMKNIIARAKERGEAVKTDGLPQEIQTEALNLKESINSFLVKMEETAMLKSDDMAGLDASYEDFSKKEDEFFSAAKKYIDGMDNLGIIKEKINSEIERLSTVGFSLK